MATLKPGSMVKFKTDVRRTDDVFKRHTKGRVQFVHDEHVTVYVVGGKRAQLERAFVFDCLDVWEGDPRNGSWVTVTTIEEGS